MNVRIESQAIILAAGISRHLGPANLKPKCLLKLGGHRILDYQLAMFEHAGLENVTIITGYREHQIQKVVGNRARCVYFPDYKTSNNLYALRYFRHLLDRPTVIVFSDVLIEFQGFARLFESHDDFVLLVDSGSNLPRTMRIKMRDGMLTGIGEDVSSNDCGGNFIGIMKTSERGAAILSEELEAMYSENTHSGEHYTCALPRLAAKGASCDIENVADVPWLEIDNVAGYLAARKKIKNLGLIV